jgi:hypothetical protein
MAVYKLFPLQDATMYSFYPFMNTGIDAMIEVGNLNVNINPVPQVFRYLVEFDQPEIDTVINTYVPISSSIPQFESNIKCFVANAQGVNFNTELIIHPVSGSWSNGTGTYLDSPFTTNGVSWIAQTFSGSGGQNWQTSNFPTFVTASWSGSYQGGGTWYTGSSIPGLNFSPTQSFNMRSQKDLNVNVTDIVHSWWGNSQGKSAPTGSYDVSNEGFIVKWEDILEFNSADAIQPIIQFYSVDTNTIYPPVLEIKWDDQLFNTGDLPPLATADLFVALDNNPGVFYSESINRFRLNVRPDYPARTFQTASVDTQNHYLPNGSLWAIKDLDTNEFIVEFSPQFTKISCDPIGNYFDVYMAGLQPERYYKILIQSTISGSRVVKDDNYYFKVVNG